MKTFTLSLCCIFLRLGTAFAQRTLIHWGNLLAVNTSEMRPQMTIVVEKNKITRVEKGYTQAGTGDEAVDLKNSYVLPGRWRGWSMGWLTPARPCGSATRMGLM